MYEVYKIGEEQLGSAAFRTIKTAFKFMVIVYLAVMAYLVWVAQPGWEYLLAGSAVCIPAYGVALLIGYILLKQRYRRYRIVLDDEGVEFYMPPNEKKIKWGDLTSLNNADGTITVLDKNKAAIYRWLTGEGRIDIISELEHLDELRQHIDSILKN